MKFLSAVLIVVVASALLAQVTEAFFFRPIGFVRPIGFIRPLPIAPIAFVRPIGLGFIGKRFAAETLEKIECNISISKSELICNNKEKLTCDLSWVQNATVPLNLLGDLKLLQDLRVLPATLPAAVDGGHSKGVVNVAHLVSVNSEGLSNDFTYFKAGEKTHDLQRVLISLFSETLGSGEELVGFRFKDAACWKSFVELIIQASRKPNDLLVDIVA